MFEGMQKKAESADNTNAPIETTTEKNGLRKIIEEGRSISEELQQYSKEYVGQEVVVDMKEYLHIKQQQKLLYELFMGNPELTRVVCKREGIIYDPRLDEMRRMKYEKKDNQNIAPIEAVS